MGFENKIKYKYKNILWQRAWMERQEASLNNVNLSMIFIAKDKNTLYSVFTYIQAKLRQVGVGDLARK